MATFTAFCQDVNGRGTVWIDTVQAGSVADAIAAAFIACASAWETEPDSIHCLGIAAGDVEILHWEDLQGV